MFLLVETSQFIYNKNQLIGFYKDGNIGLAEAAIIDVL